MPTQIPLTHQREQLHPPILISSLVLQNLSGGSNASCAFCCVIDPVSYVTSTPHLGFYKKDRLLIKLYNVVLFRIIQQGFSWIVREILFLVQNCTFMHLIKRFEKR